MYMNSWGPLLSRELGHRLGGHGPDGRDPVLASRIPSCRRGAEQARQGRHRCSEARTFYPHLRMRQRQASGLLASRRSVLELRCPCETGVGLWQARIQQGARPPQERLFHARFTPMSVHSMAPGRGHLRVRRCLAAGPASSASGATLSPGSDGGTLVQQQGAVTPWLV